MDYHEPWITCRTGKKVYLLAKDEKAYYLIEVGKHLDYETEEWLQQQGVSEALLKELKLGFTYIPKAALRGVAFTGTEAGENLYLYLKSEKKKLTLELDYTSAWLDGFFLGIPRLTAPKKKEMGAPAWRKKQQDQQLFHRLRFVAPAFLIISIAAGVGYLVTDHWAVYTLCLLCLFAQIGLALVMPAYFTIYLPINRKRQNVWDLEGSFIVLTIILLLRARLGWLSYEALWYLLPIGAVFGAIIYWRVVDFHYEKWALPAVMLLGAFGCFVMGGQINAVYDFKEPQSYVLEVEELDFSSGKNRSYYCWVTLPDEREVRLNISQSLYRELDVGDSVRVEHSTGILGIEYAKAYPIE